MLSRSEDQCSGISLQVANSFIASTKYFSFSRSYIPKVSCSLVSCYFSAVSECTIMYFHVSQIQCLMTCNKRAKMILQSTARTYIITAWLKFFHIKSQALTTLTRKNTALLQKEASPVLGRGDLSAASSWQMTRKVIWRYQKQLSSLPPYLGKVLKD